MSSQVDKDTNLCIIYVIHHLFKAAIVRISMKVLLLRNLVIYISFFHTTF